MLKYEVYTVTYLPMNWSLGSLRDLSLNFQRQTFQLAMLTSKRSKNANITIAIRQEVRYLQSNGVTANAVHHDLVLNLQGHEI